MKKKIIALLLAGTMALPLSACGGSSSASSGSKKTAETNSVAMNFIFNGYGLQYGVPSSWRESGNNSDDYAYFFKNPKGSHFDGMLFVSFLPITGDLFSKEVLDSIKEGLIFSNKNKEISSETVRINDIKMEKISFNMESDDGEAFPTEAVVFKCNDNAFMFALSSKTKNEYDDEWKQILENIDLTDPDNTESTYKGSDESSKPADTEEASSDNAGSNTNAKYNIDDCGITFAGDYRNDTTGKWRLATTSSDFDIQDYALSYYNKYFKAKDEIHVIVNFNRMTTTKISNMGGILDVSIHDYVKHEEHDAKKALEGTLLNEYHVDMNSGKVTKIQ